MEVFSSNAALTAAAGAAGSWEALGNFIVAGLEVTQQPGDSILRVGKYVGEQNVPGDIKRLRRSVHELMRRMGQPVLIKHMFNDLDTDVADRSDNFQSAYGQVRNRDPLSYGIGYHSKQLSANEWIAPDGTIVNADLPPGTGFVPAPMYRGFGPGYLTYLIEPDVAEDFFKITSTGAFIRIQQAQAVTPWFPDINDNDLIINVTLDREGRVLTTHERYQAKMTNPVSIRGLDRRGRQEYSADFGNRHVVNQVFQMSLVPENNILYHVEVDR